MAASFVNARPFGGRSWSRSASRRSRIPSRDALIVLASAALGGGIVVGMALDIAPLAMVAAVAAIAASLVSPVVGLSVLAFMAPLKPPASIPAPGFDTAMVGAILLGCIYRLPLDRPRFRTSLPVILLIGFILFVTVSQLPDMVAGWSGTVGHLVGYEYFQILTGFGAVLAAVYVLSNRSPVPVLVMGLAGAGVAALIAVVMFRVSYGPFINLAVASTDGSRALGPFGNPNYLGVFMAIAMCAALGLAVGGHSKRVRAALIATAVLLGAAIAVSLSREALIAAAAGVFILVWFKSRRLAIVAILVGAPAALVIYPAFVEWRLISETGAASAAAYAATALSDSGRLVALAAGPQMFLSSPIVGVGFGHYIDMSVLVGGAPYPIDAHNWYMTVLAEDGSVGILLWMGLLAAILLALRTRPAAAQAVGVAVFAAFAAGSVFLEPPTSFQTMALPALFLVAALVGRWGPEGDGPAAVVAAAPAGIQVHAGGRA